MGQILAGDLDRGRLGLDWRVIEELQRAWKRSDRVDTWPCWLWVGEVCDGCLAPAQLERCWGVLAVSLSMEQSDQVPACPLALVSCWREQT